MRCQMRRAVLAAAGAAVAAVIWSAGGSAAGPMPVDATALAKAGGEEAIVHQARRRFLVRRYRYRGGGHAAAGREGPTASVAGGPSEQRPAPLMPVQHVEPCKQLVATGVACSRSF